MSDYLQLAKSVAKVIYQHPDALQVAWPLYNSYIKKRGFRGSWLTYPELGARHPLNNPMALRGTQKRNYIDAFGDNINNNTELDLFTGTTQDMSSGNFRYRTTNTGGGVGSMLSAYKGHRKTVKKLKSRSTKLPNPTSQLLKSFFPVLTWYRRGFHSQEINTDDSGFQGVHAGNSSAITWPVYTAGNTDAPMADCRNNESLDADFAYWWTRAELHQIYAKVLKDTNITNNANSIAGLSMPPTGDSNYSAYDTGPGLQCLGGYRKYTIYNTGTSIVRLKCYIMTHKQHSQAETRGPWQVWANDLLYSDQIMSSSVAPYNTSLTNLNLYGRTINTPGEEPDKRGNKNFNNKYKVLQKTILTIAPGQTASVYYKIPKQYFTREQLFTYDAGSASVIPDSLNFIKNITHSFGIVGLGQLAYDTTVTGDTTKGIFGPAEYTIELNVEEKIKWRASPWNRPKQVIMTQIGMLATTAQSNGTLEDQLYPTLSAPKITNPHGEMPDRFAGDGEFDAATAPAPS